nr:potassium transporter TrkG [Brucepastera parasyntrophica]
MRFRLSADKIQLFSYFIGIALLGSALLSLPVMYVSEKPASYIDALFTSVSAVCVTGLSTLPMDIYSPAGLITIMILIELGGLGLVTFFLWYIAIPKKKVSLVNRAVIRDYFIEDVETDPKKIIRTIAIFTFGIQLLCAIILFFSMRTSGAENPLLDAFFLRCQLFAMPVFHHTTTISAVSARILRLFW